MASLKMYCRVSLSYLLAIFLTVNAREYVPVLLLESPNPGGKEASMSALSKMSTAEFSDVLLRRLVGSPVVVVFSEETLSVEDFSRQDAGAHGSFPALKALTKETGSQFLPAVQSPGKALNRLDKQGYKWEHIHDGTLPQGGKKVIVVPLDDANPTDDRSDMLRRHDKLISNMYRRMVNKYSNVLAIYTGQHSSWTAPEPSSVRIRRDAESDAKNNCTTLLCTEGDSEQMMLYSSDCPILIMDNMTYTLSSPSLRTADTRKGSHRLVVMYPLNGTDKDKVTLRYRFNFGDDGYWNVSQVELERTSEGSTNTIFLNSSNTIISPFNFSYYASQGAVFQNPEQTVQLKFSNLQVQPGVQRCQFGTVVSDVYFFSAPIWAGLLITFLLLFIVAWGISMMMDIHTMDRFDDPKGKTLFINAQE